MGRPPAGPVCGTCLTNNWNMHCQAARPVYLSASVSLPTSLLMFMITTLACACQYHSTLDLCLQAAIQLVASPAAGQRPAGISPRASVSGGTAWQPLLGSASADGNSEGQVSRTRKSHDTTMQLMQTVNNKNPHSWY